MVTNLNNSHINSFTKGMNSDQSFDQIENTQYIFGRNLRITKNQLIGSRADGVDYTSLHEGIVSPVFGELYIDVTKVEDDLKRFAKEKHTILAVDSVDNLGTIVTRDSERYLCVYKFTLTEGTADRKDVCDSFELFWKSNVPLNEEHLVSTVLYRELDNVIKLYIATGEYPIITLRVDGTLENKYVTKDGFVELDYVINNRILPQDIVKIVNIVSGKLKTSLVQYTYRLYNKYGVTTLLAPLTNKIQVIDPTRSRENGNAEDTETSLGFTLQINVSKYTGIYERLQVFRVLYIKYNEDADVSMIYDGEIKADNGIFQFNDVGTDPLQVLTMEEFTVMSGLIVIPEVIELNQEYMFAANVKDDTIITGVRFDNEYQNKADTDKIKLVSAQVELDYNISTDSLYLIPTIRNVKYKDSSYNSMSDGSTVSGYLESRNVNSDLATATYNNIFTSSLLRSLRRGEKYKYGIVYYDKYGRRTDVLNIGNIDVQDIKINPTFQYSNGLCVANPIGVQIEIPQPHDKYGNLVNDIIGCLIVRRSSEDIYQKTLLLVALARPVRLALYTETIEDLDNIDKYKKIYSPFYPTGFLWSGHTRIGPGYYDKTNLSDFDALLHDDYIRYENIGTIPSGNDNFTAISRDNNGLFQIFSSEIDFRRDDMLSKLLQSETILIPLFALYATPHSDLYDYFVSNFLVHKVRDIEPFEEDSVKFIGTGPSSNSTISNKSNERWIISVYRKAIGQSSDHKVSDRVVLDYYNRELISSELAFKIKNIKDVKIPQWEDGFSNHQFEGSYVSGGIKKYKTFNTSVDQFVYNNWISSALYDLRMSESESVPNISKDDIEQFLTHTDATSRHNYYLRRGAGYIGPGPSCLLMTLDIDKVPENNKTWKFDLCPTVKTGTYICNITHNIDFVDSEPDEAIQYFGFGNYFNLEKVDDVYKVNGKDSAVTVFDGDIYITPHELTTMYKCYDFNSPDTLQSLLITNYVPLESKVNTYFDYGMNLLNTQSANLMYEPGQIEGVTSQDRPVHQYNSIYSSNDVSNDVFTLISTSEDETNDFHQRTYFSEPKTNGENIDNFLIFKPASFIDVSSKYGEITNLLTDKNILYYWQDTAFGKFSVNERSLINDNNGNTIMLGQAGVLQRNDYINTLYGMRMYDFSAISAEHGVYWIDINNRAIVAATQGQAVNYGEQIGVLNIINGKISTDVPKIDYDVQNNELICKCFGNSSSQLIFNLKYNIATSLYDRTYDDIVYIKNHMYGLYDNGEELKFSKYNYLTYLDNPQDYLKPLKLDFIVNPAASTTKVYDSQQIVPIKRPGYTETLNALDKVKMAFETDITSTSSKSIDAHTDREGNIIYNIPRFGGAAYGNRIRGKWMRVNITEEEPNQYFTISHILTKFRQSYS